ncbi:hypothetical protein L1987_58735 [Smallanthus sonchifolius]|uniref:Uncharacterized protein n=1 Tax=Smallanthus sonchifolius TaxID=185202 RepID=A0ACB9D376_9ASTR|nr:hypothetical protein L1987_58735 [Smallanthus sonchifolius]
MEDSPHRHPVSLPTKKIVSLNYNPSLYPSSVCSKRALFGEAIDIQSLCNTKVMLGSVGLEGTCISDATTFDKIGEAFGRTILPSEFSWEDDDNSFACCYLLTNIGSRIEEEIVINWKNTSYPVWVNEEMNSWSPLFVETNQTMEEGENSSSGNDRSDPPS